MLKNRGQGILADNYYLTGYFYFLVYCYDDDDDNLTVVFQNRASPSIQ